MTGRMFVCPACKKKRGVDISFGMPTNETIEQVERGEAVLGGCCPVIGDPERQCLDCGHQWPIAGRRTSSAISITNIVGANRAGS